MTLLGLRMTMNDKRKSTGAGLVVVQNRGGKLHVLGLEHQGEYDFPKGQREEGETDIDCARRECWEEASISDVVILPATPLKLEDRLTLFLATSSQQAHIMANPKTGHFEHEKARWFPLDGDFSEFKGYLQVACLWAKQCIQMFDMQDMIEDEKW